MSREKITPPGVYLKRKTVDINLAYDTKIQMGMRHVWCMWSEY